MRPYNFFRILKLCSKFGIEVKNVDCIEISKKNKYKLNPEYYLNDEEIDKLICPRRKNKLIALIVGIFLKADTIHLMNLIKSKIGPDVCRSLLDLLSIGELKLDDLHFSKMEDLNIFQKILLSISKTKKEVQYAVSISQGFLLCLTFIKDNVDLLLTMDSYLFPIKLNSIGDKNTVKININDIFNIVNDIAYKSADKKLKIIDIEEIFTDLLNYASYKDLKELCKLKDFLPLLSKDRRGQDITRNFYIKIHQRGIDLIKNKKLTTDEIFSFIMVQDVFYFKPIFNKNELRDPEIFKYIPIVKNKKKKIDREYINNIKKIKDNSLFLIFNECSYDTKKRFYQILLGQMEIMSDIKAIFDIFPIKFIDRDFTFEINGTIDKLKYTILDEEKENENMLFDIMDNWLTINYSNRLDLNYNTQILEMNYDFTSRYYFHIFKSQKMQLIVKEIRNNIINFYLGQNYQQKNNAESLIFLLLNSLNDQSTLYVLDQMNKLIMTLEDFYTKEENQNYQLFKLFSEKCGGFFSNPRIKAGNNYLSQTIEIKFKIVNELNKQDVKYDLIINLIDEEVFYNKIKTVFIDIGYPKFETLYYDLKKNVEICRKKFEELEKINDYFNAFFSSSKKHEIDLINKKLSEYKKQKINDILGINNFFQDEDNFDLDYWLEESKKIKYRDSCFFMAIYRMKKINEILEKNEEQIFSDSINEFRNTLTEIINQKESKKPFFEINNVKEILKETQNKSNDMAKEIDFISIEFAELGKNDYIKNNLLNDLINFSNKEKIAKLIQSIIYFIEAFDKIKNIEKTEFLDKFKNIFDSINSSQVSGEEIKKGIDLLKKYDYDIKNETTLIKFYELLLGKEESITFIKKIKDSNLEIRNLNEFIDESETSELQMSDIDNLINVYSFFEKLMKNDKIKTDEDLLKIFKETFNKEKQIEIKLQNYLNSYGELIQLFESYGENPEMTIQKIESILKDSKLYIFEDKKTNLFTFKIDYINKNNIIVENNESQLEELRNKLLLSSSTSSNANNNEKDKDNLILNKSELTKKYIGLIENVVKLIKFLNNLLKSGYPDLAGFNLEIKDSVAKNEKGNLNLDNLMTNYKNKNRNFREAIKNGFKNYPLLRLFYGKQFIQIYENAKKKNVDISHLINSVTLNQIKNSNLDYNYDDNISLLENINSYLEKLFKNNNIKISEIYKENQVLPDVELMPGLYRKTKSGQSSSSDLIYNILNIYLNLTGNVPIINTLLICNEDTSTEQIRAFLYRAFFSETPTLFLICNMECLDLSATSNLIKTLKELYKSKKGLINSYLLFIYEKLNSGLVRDIEKLIPEKNILNDIYLAKSENKNKTFDSVELYSSKFSGYGKTTEIIYKVKEKGGDYRYLPIGGSINRDYVINNLIDLNLNLQKGKTTYLHLDLSETDNDDLMNEI